MSSKTNYFNTLNSSSKRALCSFGVLILLFAIFSFLDLNSESRRFLTENNLQNLLQQVIISTILACGLTFCIVGGGNDLSAGASMALSAIIVLMLMLNGVNMWLSILAGLLVGILTGIINGFFIEILGVVPFIATLATQWIYRGVANSLVNGIPLYTRNLESQYVQDAFHIFGGGRFANGLSYSVIITLVYIIALYIILSKTRIGKQIYACGSNLEAAKLSGINAVSTRMFAYCISGLSAAIAGILFASRFRSAQPTTGQGLELEAIASAILGGIAISGGEGTIINTVLGALMIGILRNGLNLNGFNSFNQQIILGAILVFAVAFQTKNPINYIRHFKIKSGGNK